MSICNVYITQYQALLAVDTKALLISPSGRTRATEKQKAFQVGRNCVVAARGNCGLLPYLRDSLPTPSTVRGIDALLPRLAETCQAAWRSFESFRMSTLEGAEVPELAAGCEVTVVGWSDAFQRMMAAVATLSNADGVFQIDAIPASCAAPGIWASTEIPDISTPELMFTAMHQQVGTIRRTNPSAQDVIGGRARIYQLSPTTTSVILEKSLEQAGE